MNRLLCLLAIVALAQGCAHARRAAAAGSCTGNPAAQAAASQRLQEIAAADQSDRSGPSVDWASVSPRDLARRIEVAELFARGCMVSAPDYAAGAIVYQHGDTADHAHQAFIWSKRGLDLNDESQRWLMAAALDRYLLRIGQKQLFATQYSKAHDDPCWCLDQVEQSFPDEERVKFTKKSHSQALSHVKEMNKEQPACAKASVCSTPLKATPRGTVPGFW